MSGGQRWGLVLGASVGSGAAISRALARDPGLHICGIHRGNHPEAAQALTADVEAQGRQVRWIEADGASEEGAGQITADLVESLGAGCVSMFVHALADASVGTLAAGPPKPLSAKRLRRTFESMAHSFVWWTRALLDGGALAPDGARLLGLSNPLHDVPLPGCAGIAAAKGALRVYVRYLALELGDLGHRVNLLTYGAAETHALQAVVGRSGQPGIAEAVREGTPAGELVNLDDVGQMASMLAGEAGQWFNGADIDFSGGMGLGLLAALTRRNQGNTA